MRNVEVKCLLGPARSGKTRRCLDGVRKHLLDSPSGPPLLFVAPKQSTYDLERQLLADGRIPGYTRLHILSFERLARFLLRELHQAPPELLDEEGRLMVLRGLLARERDALALFRASARLTGFAQQVSETLREFQAHQISPARLRQLAQNSSPSTLAAKLHDLALLLERYIQWLADRELQDSDSLLDSVVRVLTGTSDLLPRLAVEHLWVDGFNEFSAQELQLIAALLPACNHATLTFCLDRLPNPSITWLSGWSLTARNFQSAVRALQSAPNITVVTTLISRPAHQECSENTVLRHLEESWHDPKPFPSLQTAPLSHSLRIVQCANPDGEVTLAAREILRFARAGGRFREIVVLVRDFQGYLEPLRRIFARFEIPCFIDRRESVAHHPLAELTRGALRTIASDWARADWFAALKTGLVRVSEPEIDLLENEALARGWKGAAWREPLGAKDAPNLASTLRAVQERIMPPFLDFRDSMVRAKFQPTGAELAIALRQLWDALHVLEQLEDWADQPHAETESRLPAAVHLTVWEQMNAWLENVELAFPSERLHIREWLPVLEAGLSNLTVGLVPPALDQVLAGTIDRSRDFGARLVIILGLNEGRFPAPPKRGVLLTESDRVLLEHQGILHGTAARYQLGRESFLAYLALSRARERLLLTTALEDSSGRPLNPSSFLTVLARLFPGLRVESRPERLPWQRAEHASELVEPLLTALADPTADANRPLFDLAQTPKLNPVFRQLQAAVAAQREPASLGSALATRLYGPVLRTSVSRLEHFAACPFKFFVSSGLRAEDRRLFELDVKEQGTFLHDVLSEFHNSLKHEGLRWRDISPQEARDRIGLLTQRAAKRFRDGLLHATEQARFQVRLLSGVLEDFVEVIVGWMQEQYLFEPAVVELPFGEPGSPEWNVPLSSGRTLKLRGRIDRVDVWQEPGSKRKWFVVVDYKSGHKQLDPVLIANGLQLQLLGYLNVLSKSGEWCAADFENLVPAGVFYVSLRGRYPAETNRNDAFSEPGDAKKLAYQHTGRFDAAALRLLDARTGVVKGDQFRYRLKKDGTLHSGSRDPLPTGAFRKLVRNTENVLQALGNAIYEGDMRIAPFRFRSMTACQQCDYAAICRMDPWLQSYRLLQPLTDSSPDSEDASPL